MFFVKKSQKRTFFFSPKGLRPELARIPFSPTLKTQGYFSVCVRRVSRRIEASEHGDIFWFLLSRSRKERLQSRRFEKRPG